MGKLAVHRLARFAPEVIGPLLHHRSMGGGSSSFLLGAKGCGKTTGLLNFATSIYYTDPQAKMIMPETVIWRGRSLDYWNRLPVDRRMIWIHDKDLGKMIWTTNYADRLDPEVGTYTDVHDLIDQIQRWEPGCVHVVYGPSGLFEISAEFAGAIQLRRKELLKALRDHELDIDAIFWFDMLVGLTRYARPDWFCSWVGDEIQRLFPQSPRGLRYVLQSYIMQEILPDMRKTNKSMYLASHGTGTIDYRLYPLIQTWGYMRGSRPRPGSLVRKSAPATLDPGVIIFDGGLFATSKFVAFPVLPLTITQRPAVRFPPIAIRGRKGEERGKGNNEIDYLGDIVVPAGGD